MRDWVIQLWHSLQSALKAFVDRYVLQRRQEPYSRFVTRGMRGDYFHNGADLPTGGTNVDKLMKALASMNARDYMHQVWFPGDWETFQTLAPRFAEANRRLWLYLVPPSEPPCPSPYMYCYVSWAVECAKLAKEFPVVSGLCIDDFDSNAGKFRVADYCKTLIDVDKGRLLSASYCKTMMHAAHEFAPNLKLFVVNYFGPDHWTKMQEHVETRAIDGVVFPYRGNPSVYCNGVPVQWDPSDTTPLLPQIKSYRKWLTDHTAAGQPSVRLVPMIYASRYSQARGTAQPTADYVKECLDICVDATQEGLADGVVTYCLPKGEPTFLKVAAEAFK